MLTTYPQIIIHPKKVAAIQRRHPWIFSGAIKRIPKQLQTGDVVEVFTPNGQYLATGHYQEKGSISVRIISFEQKPIDLNFWIAKLQNAYQVRQQIGLLNEEKHTNAFRLIHGEGDGLPGLILDVYHGTVVLQAHAVGMYQARFDIVEALQTVLGDQLRAVYLKSAESLPRAFVKEMEIENGYLYGSSSSQIVVENGHSFWIDWEQGQKTGFFIDQRDNRQLLSKFVKGKTVLNAFCYSGGFSIYALQAGAKLVHSVDSSAKAIAWADKNVHLNSLAQQQHQSFTQDVLDFLKQSTTDYEVMVLDPPAFAKHIKSKHNAIQGYKRLNALGLQKIAKGGILFTFSCSQVIDQSLFVDTIRAAAITVGRNIRILHRLQQPADHPVSIYHPEGKYLKGLVLRVE